ncbi:MAG: methyltransferase domain-containing protein [Desulfuromonadales bacterium]
MNILLLNEPYIQMIYERHVLKGADYAKKHVRLPMQNPQRLWRWEDMDFPRVPCIIEFEEWITKHNLACGNKLLATGFDPELELLDYRSIRNIPYQNGQNDLHRLDLDEKDFDFMVFGQTLEHLYQPVIALQRIKNHLRPGGHVYTCVPTINIPHMMPNHFYGYTPIGLCTLFISCGFEVIELGYWGCEKYIHYIFEHHTWPDYRILQGSDGLMPANEECNVAQCWILARRP